MITIFLFKKVWKSKARIEPYLGQNISPNSCAGLGNKNNMFKLSLSASIVQTFFHNRKICVIMFHAYLGPDRSGIRISLGYNKKIKMKNPADSIIKNSV